MDILNICNYFIKISVLLRVFNYIFYMHCVYLIHLKLKFEFVMWQSSHVDLLFLQNIFQDTPKITTLPLDSLEYPRNFLGLETDII